MRALMRERERGREGERKREGEREMFPWRERQEPEVSRSLTTADPHLYQAGTFTHTCSVCVEPHLDWD